MLIARISAGPFSPTKWDPFSYHKPIPPTLYKAEPGMAAVQVYPDVFEDPSSFRTKNK